MAIRSILLGAAMIGLIITLKNYDLNHLNVRESQILRELSSQALVLRNEIRQTAQLALEQTTSLSRAPRLVRAINEGGSEELQRIANEAVSGSSALDVVALFDRQGGILAMNTIDHQGVPIAEERISRIMRRDLSKREVVASCLTNKSDDPVVEFQTHCDFTPALFDSTGLSAAFSTPILDPDGKKIGVVSSRLNFNRILKLVGQNNFKYAGSDFELVNDQGEYFSEEINAGKLAPPLAREIVEMLLADPGYPSEPPSFDRQGDLYVALMPLGMERTIRGGELHILMKVPADRVWTLRHALSWVLRGGILFFGLLSVVFLFRALNSVSLAD
jgi:hypothetical protein